MSDETRTREQLLQELADLRQQVEKLDAAKTEWMQTEELESERRFRSIARNIPVMVFQFRVRGDGSSYFAYVSPRASDLFGLPDDMDRPEWELGALVHPDDREQFFASITQAIENRADWNYEGRIITPTGEEKWFQGTSSPTLTGDELVFDGVLLDITRRKQAQEALRTEKEFTDMALDTQLDTFFLFEPATDKALRWNRAFRDIVGYTDEEIASMPAPDSYYSPKDLERARAFLQNVLEEGTGTIELEIVCKDGHKVPTEYQVSVINDDQGEPKYIISIGRDITERKRVEEALRESEERYRNIVDSIPLGMHMYELDPAGQLIFVGTNPAADKILGVNNDQFVGHTIEEAFPQLTETEIPMRYRVAASNGEGWQVDQVDYEGGQIKGAFEVHAFQTSPGRMAAAFLDITERKQVEEALRQLNATLEARVEERTAELQAQYARLNAILSSTTDGIVVTDREGNITQANPVAQTWLTEILSPEDAKRLQEAVRDLAIHADEQPEMVLELTQQYLEASAAPVVAGGAEGPSAVVDIHDISPFKELDRMKTMFIKNIAHELRTPVSTIRSYAYLMQQTPSENKKWSKYLDALVEETDQQVQLVEEIMQISRIYTGRLEIEPRPIPLNELTEAVVTSHRELAQEQGVTLEHCPMEPAPVALVDPKQMLSVLDYLVGDVIRYTSANGRAVVSTGRRQAEGRIWATVAASDTGGGIPAEDLPHIFERFFREEEPRSVRVSETGLRLMIVKGIVELHGGYVTVESGKDTGSTFTI
ncbi:MAG: PAS domain S-box protein, partial [Chloroflexota bacterium]|nr:PAS domain S-box protein [Chloroflexota bacterium]